MSVIFNMVSPATTGDRGLNSVFSHTFENDFKATHIYNAARIEVFDFCECDYVHWRYELPQGNDLGGFWSKKDKDYALFVPIQIDDAAEIGRFYESGYQLVWNFDYDMPAATNIC